MRKNNVYFASIFIYFSCLISLHAQESDSLVYYIDPRIGTANNGSNCVIGPQLPFGSINPSPQTPNGDHDGYDPGQPIRGFGQLQVSGTGWGKYGQIFVSPQIGLHPGETEHDSPKSEEKASAYEYGVTLDRYQIRTEFTPSFHTALYRFVFPASDSSNILIDVSHNIPHDIATNVGGTVSQASVFLDTIHSTISGFGKYSGGFGGGDYYVYFTTTFNRRPNSCGTWTNNVIIQNDTTASLATANDRVGGYFHFNTSEGDTILMKIAVSFKSIDQAASWLTKEIPAWDYASVRDSARHAWENELSKIRIETNSVTDKKIFYTAMYHAMLMPRNRTSDMRGFAEGVPVWDDHYAVWDTWRSLFPLMVLINPKMVAGNVNSFVERYKLNKHVQDAYIAGNDMAEEQGGNNPDNIIADAYVKGVDGIDWNAAYTVLKHDADAERDGWQGWGTFTINNAVQGSYKSKGWIPAGIMSCSKSLEYSYNDFCASEVAKGLGKMSDADNYYLRSQLWVNLWNPEAISDGYKGFVVPRNTNGSFVTIDLKKNWGSWNEYFYEGSSWTYSAFMPHQFARLVWLCGGKTAYVNRMEHAMSYKLVDYSNEPAFLAAYSFIFAGRPDRASYWSRKLMNSGFSLNGYPGNDDSGAMSSWYIFNALGFFPNAGQDYYFLTGSLYPRSTITLSNGKQLVIEAENASASNLFVQSCTLNGKDWNKAWMPHDSIKNGALIHFVMGASASSWATGDTSLEYKGCPSDSIFSQSTSVEKIAEENPAWYPNPFTQTTRMSLCIPEKTQEARLSIYNLTGAEVDTKMLQERGDSIIELSGARYKPGLYIYALRFDGKKVLTGRFERTDF